MGYKGLGSKKQKTSLNRQYFCLGSTHPTANLVNASSTAYRCDLQLLTKTHIFSPRDGFDVSEDIQQGSKMGYIQRCVGADQYADCCIKTARADQTSGVPRECERVSCTSTYKMLPGGSSQFPMRKISGMMDMH